MYLIRLLILGLIVWSWNAEVLRASDAGDTSISPYFVFEGDVLDIESSTDLKRGPIMWFRDLESGRTQRFYVDPYRTSVKIDGTLARVQELWGGSRGTIMYEVRSEEELPLLIFVNLTTSY